MRRFSARSLLCVPLSLSIGPIPALAHAADPDGAVIDPGDALIAGNSGSARWSIPIELPPGPGGLAPKLALVYSSSAGDGPFGVGWSLPLGEVACSVRHGVPAYINPGGPGITCPQFELDGDLLNYEPDYAQGESPYHTFVESFQRIRPMSGGWEVTSPDGTIRRYGETANSRIRALNGNVTRWLLSSIQDTYGNRIDFGYDRDPSTDTLDDPASGTGHTYVKRVSWAFGNRLVELGYEPRPDAIHDFAGGVERTIAYRATEIRVVSNGSIHSRHRLGYDLADLDETPTAADYTTSRSRLSWAQRFGSECAPPADPLADCVGLRAQQFRYTDPSGQQWADTLTDSDASSGWNPPPFEQTSHFAMPPVPTAYQLGDVNGDGLIDYLRAEDKQHTSNQVVLNNGSKWGASAGEPELAAQQAAYTTSLLSLEVPLPKVVLQIPFPPPTGQGTTAYGVCGGSVSDELRPVSFRIANNGMHLYLAFAVQYEISDAVNPPPAPWVQLLGNFHLVDLNGDHLADLVMSVRLGTLYKTHDCHSQPLPPNQIEPLFEPRTVQVAFRNTGHGWEQDDDLVRGLPLFGMVMMRSGFYPNEDQGCAGWVNELFNLDGSTYKTRPCLNHVSFDPVFQDLNGDGRLDVIVAEPLIANPLVVYNYAGEPYEWESRTRSRAWLSQNDGSWVRAPSFDLPFHHTHLAMPGGRQVAEHTTDAGVRIVHLNRDGYADVVWKDPWLGAGSAQPGPGYVSAAKGVLLNRGQGDGTPYSAWCSSRPLTLDGVSVAPCSAESRAARFELPDAVQFATGSYLTIPDGTMLADLNGDGWLDIARRRVAEAGTAWLFSPGAPGSASASAWVLDPSYVPPVPLGIARDGSYNVPTGSHPIDVNGDGATDWMRHGLKGGVSGPIASFVSQHGLPDLLREIRTGRGGTIQLTYDTGPRQRGFALEVGAATHANAVGESLALGQTGEASWTLSPVVTRVTVRGPNRALSQTRYRYADPRWDRINRIGLGWRIVQAMRLASGGSIASTTTSFFTQSHGRAGQLSERTTYDGSGKPLRHDEEAWDLPDPGTVGGGWSDPAFGRRSHIGRLASRSTRREYGDAVGASVGAVQRETYVYDDIHGYNFVSMVRTARTSGGSDRYFTPSGADPSRWILNLVAEEIEVPVGAAPSVLASRSRSIAFEYTSEGRVQTQTRHRIRTDDGSTSTADDVTRFFYDDYGNLRRRIDARDHTSDFEYDARTHSVLVTRTDPAVGNAAPLRTFFTPDPIFGVPISTDPEYSDVPGERIELDPFGRVRTRTLYGSDGSAWLASLTVFHDDASPPWTETYGYTSSAGQAGDAIRTATVDDGFGGVWKTIRDGAAAAGSSATRFIGKATYHFPATNQTRTTEDMPCGDSPTCASLTGRSESPAVTVTRDALGRLVSVVTAEGTTLSHYRAGVEPIATAIGVAPTSAPVDAVLTQNAEGGLVLRAFDGDRLVALEECANRVHSSLADEGCEAAPGVPHRTLYGYHANGQLQVIYDVKAVNGSLWSDPSHRLVYRFDSAGQVTQIEDPDAGPSRTGYDSVGNVIWTRNARLQLRLFAYDELDRRTSTVVIPNAYTSIAFDAGKRLPRREAGPRYSIEWTYDALGRIALEAIDTEGVTAAVAYTRDLLGRPLYVQPTRNNLIGLRYEYAGAYLKRVCRGGPAPGDFCAQRLVDDVSYDALGRRDVVHLPQGNRDYVYADDAADTDPDPLENATRHLKRDAFTSASGLSASVEYTSYDGLGNVLTWKTTRPDEGTVLGSYQYDARNRVAAWTRGGMEEPFAYDALGNLTQHGSAAQFFQHESKPHALTSRVEGAAPATQITWTYTHDESGNVRSVRTQSPTSDTTRFYSFDAANRLTCVGTTQGGCEELRVRYDLAGRRLYERAGSGVIRRYVGDDFVLVREPSGQLTMRYEALGFGERIGYIEVFAGFATSSAGPWAGDPERPPWALALSSLALFTWSFGLALRGGLAIGVARRPGQTAVAGVLIASLAIPCPAGAGGGSSRGTTVRWVLSDRIGSGIAEIDPGGAIVRYTRFKPFGGVDQEGGPERGLRQRVFAGHREQKESGLLYMNARWQDPATGTFLSVDPLIQPSDPQSHTGYSYARNNPVSNTDPTGMCTPLGEGCAGSAAGTSMLMGHGLSTALASMGAVVPGLTYPVFDKFVTASGVGAGAAGIGRFAKGLVDLVIGADFGRAWREALSGHWQQGPTGGVLPESVADTVARTGGAVPANASANGMHAWHAGANAALAKQLGLIGAPVIFLGGLLHESPFDYRSFMAEQHYQGTVNHALDSVTDIGANVFGMTLGYAIPGGGAAVSAAIRFGNFIPGPGEPDPAFGGGGAYAGNPIGAWGQYP